MPSSRSAVPPFEVMTVLDRVATLRAAGRDVISLCAGEPAGGAPSAVNAEAARLHAEGRPFGYTPALGIRPLREALSGHYRRWYGVELDPARVAVTTGSSGGFLLAFLAAFEPGDRVALARPGYPAYRNILRALGCEVVELATDGTTRFQPTVELLEQLDEPVQGLIVASPANPTGTVLSRDELAGLAEWCQRNGVQLVSDEIYHGLSYTGQLHTAWEFSREAIVVNSFSKYWCMTGWRLGWMLVPERLRRAVDTLTGNFTLCPPALSQHAALAAFTPEAYAEVAEHVARYRENRELLLRGLAELGITRVAPADGAFYVWADISEFTDDSAEFCQRLLAETGLAMVPGGDFDPVEGHRFVRMSFAGSSSDMQEAVSRLGKFLQR